MSVSRTLRPAIQRGTVLTNALVLIGGTALGQGIAVISLPILTRLYSPDSMGVYGLFSAFISFGVAAVGLRYEMAIVSPKSSREATNLLAIAVGFTLPVGAVLTIGLLFMHRFEILGFEALPVTGAFVAYPVLVLAGLFTSLRFWLLRGEEFGVVARVTVAQNIARTAAQLALFGLAGQWLGLLIGDLAGRAAGIGTMVRKSAESIRREIPTLSGRRMVIALRRYREFPLYNLPSSLIDAIALTIPVPMIAQQYGVTAAGFFALTQRAMQLPLGLIGKSVADAFHSRVALYNQTESSDISSLFYRTAKVLFGIGLIPMLVVMAFGKVLFPLVFGEQWLIAGILSVAVAPWAFAQFVVSPLSRVVVVLNGQRLKLVFDALSLVAAIAPIILASRLGLSLYVTVWVVSAGQVVSYLVYFFLLANIVKRADRVY